jgi:hypothetical protein
MEMTWLETFELLGLDLLALLVLVLWVLDRADHALHHAWMVTRSRVARRPAQARRPVAIGAPRHV